MPEPFLNEIFEVAAAQRCLRLGPAVQFIGEVDGRSHHDSYATETCFLLTRQKVAAWRLLESLGSGAVRIALRLDAEAEAVRDLMTRYSNIPMCLADACIVRLAEISGLPVCTLDSDFTIYRAGGRRRLALITTQHQR